MRKILIAVVAMAMVFCMAACASSGESSTPESGFSASDAVSVAEEFHGIFDAYGDCTILIQPKDGGISASVSMKTFIVDGVFANYVDKLCSLTFSAAENYGVPVTGVSVTFLEDGSETKRLAWESGDGLTGTLRRLDGTIETTGDLSPEDLLDLLGDAELFD
jgi:hypothetical protein